jgi:proteasome assembly chaperone 3
MASATLRRTLNDDSVLDVVLQLYSDRTLVLITQLGKVGNLVRALGCSAEPMIIERSRHLQIQASIPDTSPLPARGETELPEPPAAIQLTPLLGSPSSEHLQALHSTYASQASTIVWVYGFGSLEAGPRQPVIVGIALKRLPDPPGNTHEEERAVFTTAMSMLRELLSRG